jgi:hypothetical protein
MKRIVYTLILTITLTGCASEVDKCVEDNLRSWEDKERRIRAGERIPSPFFTGKFEEPDNRSVLEMRALLRNHCLSISGRVKN